MMMNVDSLKYLDEQSRQAAGVTVLEKTDPRFRRELIDGKVVATEVKPDYRKHVVTDLRDIPAAAAKWAQAKGVCWINAERIVLQFDDADRRDAVACPLAKSALHVKLLEIAAKGAILQREFLDLLIEVFDEFMLPSIVSQVATIKAVNTSRTETSFGRGTGRDKGTSEFVSEVNAENPLPETVKITGPLYRDLPFETHVTIGCRLKCEAIDAPVTFALQPLPDALELALAETLRFIQRYLEDTLPEQEGEPFPVFIGTP